MSNTTNPEAWAAQERLRFIERSLWWRGQVKRKDLRELFGISLAQASSDLQRYLEINPTAARYDLKAKTYRGEPGMACVYHTPQLEDALLLFLPEHGDGLVGRPAAMNSTGHLPTARVTGVSLPVRRATPSVERAAFYAVWANMRLRIDYASLSGRREAEAEGVGSITPGARYIVPHAFANNGYRWHVRAWCEENRDYRDFVLSRIRKVEWPADKAPENLPPDVEWETIDELVLSPNPELSANLRESVAWDFGITDGLLRLKVRRAMRNYTLMHLNMPTEGMNRLPPLLVALSGKG
ncbi:MAG: WYL domain-containing protein [Verrucomicrobiales bacterium]|nr:WYL domain-containing protein [Verrucomicrobiales bacterium]